MIRYSLSAFLTIGLCTAAQAQPLLPALQGQPDPQSAQSSTQQPLSQQQNFVISDIRIDGLQRISPGVMFSLLPVSIGDTMQPGMTGPIIRSVTESGYFEEVEVAREGDVLLITVLERPSVSEINIEGNRVLQTEDILENMASAEIVEGGIFTRATLEAIRQGIQEVYSSRGRY